MRIVADQNIPLVTEAFGDFGDVVTRPGRELARADIAQADILLVRSVTKVDHRLLAGSPVRFVGTATSGIDHVDTAYLAERAITFASAPGSNANSVAEYVVSALFAILSANGERLAGRSVGIIGCGHIGSRVESLLSVLGCHCLRNDPPRERRFGDGPYVPITEALQADIVCLHVSLTATGPDRTHGLLNSERIAHLQPGAILINAARGDVIDEAALLSYAAKHPQLRLVVDCWAGEPDVSTQLLARAIIGTSHIAGYSYAGKLRATADLHRSVAAFLGVRPTWIAPPVSGPDVPLSSKRATDLEADIATAVLACYDVRNDAAALRNTLSLSAEQRVRAFDRLRRDYPMRYEFADCVLKPMAVLAESTLQTTLMQLGFKGA